MNYIVTGPLLAVTSGATIAAADDDMLALIEAHREAYRALTDAPSSNSNEEDEPLYQALDLAYDALIARRPRTLEEVQIKAEYFASSTSFSDYTDFSEGSAAASLAPMRIVPALAELPSLPPPAVHAAFPDDVWMRIESGGQVFDVHLDGLVIEVATGREITRETHPDIIASTEPNCRIVGLLA